MPKYRVTEKTTTVVERAYIVEAPDRQSARFCAYDLVGPVLRGETPARLVSESFEVTGSEKAGGSLPAVNE